MTNIIKMDTAVLDKLIREFPERTDKFVREVAFDAEGEMKARAVVDTGAMKNSVHTVMSDFNNFAAAQAASRGSNGNARLAAHPTPPRHSAYVGPGVDYAEFVELGTHRMAAQPFVIPGLNAAERKLKERAEELFK